MDMESGRQQFITSIRKYRYVLLIVLTGVVLMLMPQNTGEPQVPMTSEKTCEPDLEAKLSAILSHVSGVGKTEVLLTEAQGSDTIYQMDSGQNQSNLDTVIVTDGSREEKGLVKQVMPPKYKGAVVVCRVQTAPV